MDERKSFSPGDVDDTLLFEKLQEHVLEKYPNPKRVGCIDHSILKTWVYSPQELDLFDPKYLHVLKCAECTRELIELRRLRNEETARDAARTFSTGAIHWWWIGLGMALLCCLAAIGIVYWRSAHPPTQTIPAAPVAVTIDLSKDGVMRGVDQPTFPPVVLPRRVVNAHILLPFLSPGGGYVVSVTADQNGGLAKATASAIASISGIHTGLTVALDLRGLSPGTYYLATTHDGDRSSYYYPLRIR